ncbi:DUF2249 domain-containing protein [Mesorhizobium sp. ANAO-SY3R2]|uniref:DUF2249 domain-containing protein n=1 Tax=Mesorhizobium sp. ANAO-SY3R2 TaxID=3166644 RepID=UPI00367286C1
MTVTQTGAKPSIDVRAIARAERHPRIFGMVGALTPGEALVIVSDHDPRPLHYQLEMALPGQLSWDYLEQGPEIWRVEIARHKETGCDCCCGGH